MSNPGVITLSKLRKVGPNIKRFDIEDNIGEAIHIHWNEFRLDMTVKEFLRLSDELMRCEKSLTRIHRYTRDNFDPYFLFRMGPLVSRITSIEIQERRLGDLTCLVSMQIPGLARFKLPRPIIRTPAYRYLKGHLDSFLDYEQDAYPGVDNEARIKKLTESIRQFGYPNNNQYVTLFGDQNYIRDGQHRAACLAAEGGVDQNIQVMVVYLSGQGWQLQPYRTFLHAVIKALLLKMPRKAKGALRKIRESVSSLES